MINNNNYSSSPIQNINININIIAWAMVPRNYYHSTFEILLGRVYAKSRNDSSK
jgi:hypothetical protein